MTRSRSMCSSQVPSIALRLFGRRLGRANALRFHILINILNRTDMYCGARRIFDYNLTCDLMKRKTNWLVWGGFAAALLAVFSYIPFFTRFPITRDFPWANLLLFVLAGSLLAVGLRRAFTQPDRFRGKISGSILSVLTAVLFAFFCFGVFYEARRLPGGAALHAGDRAPDFSLEAANGKLVKLAELRQKNRAVLLIFYRGHW